MMTSPDAPVSLIHEGRLAYHDLYKTAKLSEREAVLVRGRDADGFPEITPTDPWDGTGVLPKCHKSLANGDTLSIDQWGSLQTWHSGLSCKLVSRPKQGVLFDIKDPRFLAEFHHPNRRQNVKNATKDRILLCYSLKRGCEVPPNIGIERDGENHVCLYPIGNNMLVSDIAQGAASFTIDQLVALQNSWKPYAILQLRGAGFNWPRQFPPDSDLFPFRSWVTTVVSYGESDVALSASVNTEDYVAGNLEVFAYLEKMLHVATMFASDCDCDDFETNVCVLKALRFLLNANLLLKENRRTSFMFKSTRFDDDKAFEEKIASTDSSVCEVSSRSLLAIEGGRTVLSAAASINLLYIDAKFAALFALPFKVSVESVELVFDEIEPSPVVEDTDNDGGENDKCDEVVGSFPQTGNADSVRVYIEASATTAFAVELTTEECNHFVAACQNCFGYTARKSRCKNKRRSLQGEKVWCYHHKAQELEYRRFVMFGERPKFCCWWESNS